jgi:hypothetical protein
MNNLKELPPPNLHALRAEPTMRDRMQQSVPDPSPAEIARRAGEVTAEAKQTTPAYMRFAGHSQKPPKRR